MFIIKPTEIPSLSFLINSHFFLHPVFATADQQQHLSSRGQQEVLQQPAQVQLSPAEHLNSLLTSWIQHLRPAAFSEKLRQWSRFWQHNIVCFFFFIFLKRIQPLFKVVFTAWGVSAVDIEVSLCTISQHVGSDMLVYVCCLHFTCCILYSL